MKISKMLIPACAAFIFSIHQLFSAPVITQVSPNFGPATSIENEVIITGSGFSGVTSVKFGPTESSAFTYISDTQISAIVPKSVPGTVHISVTAGIDTSATTPADRYTYQGNWFAYVSGYDYNNSTPKATSINLETNGTAEIPLLQQKTPYGIAITPNGRSAYIGDLWLVLPFQSATYVNAIDIVNNTSTAIPCSVAEPSTSAFIAIAPDGTNVFPTLQSINSENINSVGKIDTLSNFYTGVFSSTDSNPQGIAISPDGTKMYVAAQGSSAITVITEGVVTKTIPLSVSPWAVAITPDGTEVYVTTFNNTVYVINTSSDTVTNTLTMSGAAINGIAITPDGRFVYVTDINSGNIYQINTSTKDVAPAISLPFNGCIGIAITPDGTRAYINSGGKIAVLDLTQNPPTLLETILLPYAYTNYCIAITPDPSPAADFTATVSGSSAEFNASSSISPVGTIVEYAWNFGDGNTLTTNTPITSHSYATEGTFNVELTVTNSAGTSIAQTFTGQTMSNAGSFDNAHIAKSIVITSPVTNPEPPRKFCGKLKKRHHHHSLRLKTKWKPSPSENVVAYEVYKKRHLVRRTSCLHFKKVLHPKHYYKHHLHKYKKRLERLYKVRAVNAAALKSGFTRLKIHSS